MPQKYLREQRGTIFVEYALLVTLIAVACVVAVALLGVSALGLFNGVVF
jgi:Flp pilus assembly pilin Flp